MEMIQDFAVTGVEHSGSLLRRLAGNLVTIMKI
jgi:hypothetical protein